MRTFNTAGPCDPRRHYMLPAESRVPGARFIIDMDEYFVIHAPRQSGKTTVLYWLARSVNAAGERLALAFSCEQAAVLGDDVDAVMESLIARIIDQAHSQELPPEQMPPSPWQRGQVGNPLPIEAYKQIVGKLLDAGVQEKVIQQIIRDNPARLLGLD